MISHSGINSLLTNSDFRNPSELKIQSSGIDRVLLIGSCLMIHFPGFVYQSTGTHVDYMVVNNVANLEYKSAEDLSKYKFQIISLPLRSVIPDLLFSPAHGGEVDYVNCLEIAKNNLRIMLDSALEYNKQYGILSFVANFLVPQQNTMGRLLPRKDLRNISYVISLLNEHLESILEDYKNSYIINIDEIANCIGKRYLLDEVMWPSNHGALGSDWDIEGDAHRIHIPKPASEIYGFESVPTQFMAALWAEIEGGYRSVSGVDAVKMVIFDLDDTLWRGVIAEKDTVNSGELEGWPLGIIEAIKTLRARGIILAIASKNDEERIRSLWPNMIGPRLSLDDFAIIKINWNNKVENIREIISMANILPNSVVFVDDNPVEREQVKREIPDIRVLGESLYEIKRILMWGPELQPASISDESRRRNTLIAEQVTRETARTSMSRDEFIASLKVEVSFHYIKSADDEKFSRAFELINKTNQFNTTAKKWSYQEMASAIASGCELLTWEVKDLYSSYGLVGVAIIDGSEISQVVMSCRVFGLGVEAVVGSELTSHAERSGSRSIIGHLKQTEKNGPCQSFFPDIGFAKVGDIWVKEVA